jgi:pimeloyl-ACP methyl ester carboxylesterase
MGGMIAQSVAIRHPRRVATLTSIMSNTGHREQPQAKPEVIARLLEPPVPDRAGRIEQGVAFWKLIGSPGFEFDEQRTRDRVARDYDRCFYPEGPVRQLAAIVAHGSREPALARLSVPTLVIHGADDPLVPVACGRRTAEVVPGAELLVIEGMGHDFPVPLHARISSAIAEHARRHG